MAAGIIPSIPKEIMVDILLRLPAKSIGQFRCVSKQWSDWLSDPQFINTHLNNHRNKENLILISRNRPVRTVADVGDRNVSRAIKFRPELPDNWMVVLGSCNGLVLLRNERYGDFLVNPTTLRQVNIPNSSLALEIYDRIPIYGLGYESVSDDYKIVKLSYYNPDVYGPRYADTLVDMYSVKRCVWKRLKPSPYDHHVAGYWPGVFFNGSIHWLAGGRERGYGDPFVIAAFDLVDEKFKEIPAPRGLDEIGLERNQLVVFKGCLCIIERRNFWIMKEYSVEESWIKFSFTPPYNDRDKTKRLCFIGDDDVVLLMNEDRLIVRNMRTKMWRDLIVDGVPARFWDGGAFVESLVSPSYSAT